MVINFPGTEILRAMTSALIRWAKYLDLIKDWRLSFTDILTFPVTKEFIIVTALIVTEF